MAKPPTRPPPDLTEGQVRRLIKSFGGPSAFARLLGIGITTVHGWWQKGKISPVGMIAVRAYCEQRGVDPKRPPAPSGAGQQDAA